MHQFDVSDFAFLEADLYDLRFISNYPHFGHIMRRINLYRISDLCRFLHSILPMS